MSDAMKVVREALERMVGNLSHVGSDAENAGCSGECDGDGDYSLECRNHRPDIDAGFCDREDECLACDARHALTALASLESQVRAEERERIAKLLCDDCAKGEPLSEDGTEHLFRGCDSMKNRCDAAAIRALNVAEHAEHREER